MTLVFLNSCNLKDSKINSGNYVPRSEFENLKKLIFQNDQI